MRITVLALIALVAFGPGKVLAQNEQTLADIRQELTVLYVEVQRLRRELSTTGSPNVNLAGASVLDRVGAIEAELQRLTAQTEQLVHRIDRVVSDGTNRIGDLEFRLVELEGGDVSKLGETTTLGGGPVTPPQAVGGGTEPAGSDLAVGEEADFAVANKALMDENYQQAADLFGRFEQSYPASPLAPQANLNRGARWMCGDTRELSTES